MSKEVKKDSQYYYGVSAHVFKTLDYEKAINYKIHLAKQLRGELVSVPFTDRDDVRLNDVMKAIKFNEQLLEELK